MPSTKLVRAHPECQRCRLDWPDRAARAHRDRPCGRCPENGNGGGAARGHPLMTEPSQKDEWPIPRWLQRWSGQIGIGDQHRIVMLRLRIEARQQRSSWRRHIGELVITSRESSYPLQGLEP